MRISILSTSPKHSPLVHPYTCLILARITTFASAAAFSAATFSAIACSAAALASPSAFAFAAAFASAAAFEMPSYSQSVIHQCAFGKSTLAFSVKRLRFRALLCNPGKQASDFTYCMSYSGNLRCQRKFALPLNWMHSAFWLHKPSK